MARPKKQIVDYFPHSCTHGKTMFIIEQKYGNDGYAFWFKLLEFLGDTAGHYIDLNDESTQEFLQAKTRLSWDLCNEILDLLAKLDAIDAELWECKIVWSQNFVDGISDVYKNRRTKIPSRPSSYIQKPRVTDISTDENPQTKLNKSKGKNIIPPPIIPPRGEGEEDDVTVITHITQNDNAISGESLLVEMATGEPNKVSHSKTQKRTRKTLTSIQKARFDEFWEVWPYKVSKGQAETTWAKLDPDDELTEKIIEGVKRAIKYDRRFQPGGYKPHPSTWLNAKGWEDELPVQDVQEVNKDAKPQSNRFANLIRDGGTGQIAGQ